MAESWVEEKVPKMDASLAVATVVETVEKSVNLWGASGVGR